MAETTITTTHETDVPAELRARFGVGPGDLVVWDEGPGQTILVRFRRRHRPGDLVGALQSGPGGDALAAKKKAQGRGR